MRPRKPSLTSKEKQQLARDVVRLKREASEYLTESLRQPLLKEGRYEAPTERKPAAQEP